MSCSSVSVSPIKVAVVPVPTGFVVMPKRWVVERTHTWNERARRVIMHHDRLFAVSEVGRGEDARTPAHDLILSTPS